MSNKDTPSTPTPDPRETVEFWQAELKAAKKREQAYRKRGKDILEIYEAEKQSDDGQSAVPFNILYSNTETLLPALFSAIPRPVMERRFKDDDPVGKMASMAGKRSLEFLLDTNQEGYEPFGESTECAVLDCLLVGRGAVRVKYDATFATEGEGETATDYLTHELICTESLVWDRVHYGYAKKWHQVPWIAYEWTLTRPDVEKLLGDAQLADRLVYTEEADRADEEMPRSDRQQDQGKRKVATIYQIWDKEGGKKIRYMSPALRQKQDTTILKVEDDPLGLTGFFNQPKPLQFVKKSSNLVPTAPYDMYRTQAQELNRLTKRINRLVEAIKARGAYDGNLGDLMKKIMAEDDNALVPADINASLATEKGFENAVWMLPIDMLVAVLRELYQARESCKQVIYEITGISDIVRGSTQASETATAQTIKNQWGTLRLKRMQREVARYCRDLMRMMLELAASKFSEDTWAAMTNLPFVTTAQRQQLDAQAHAFTQMSQPLPPELQSALAQPVWGQILQILRNDLQRAYRIDIETNSTVEPEAAEDQTAITALLTAIGQTLNGLSPLIQSGAMPFQAAQGLLLFIARRFRFGSEIEDYIQAMQAPKPPDAGQEQAVEAQRQQAMQDVQHQQKQAQLSVKEQAMQAELAQRQREMQLQMREHQVQMAEQQLQLKHQAQQQQLNVEAQRAKEQLNTQQTLFDLQSKKYNTERVVNAKADSALGQGVKSMEGVVQQLAKMQAAQAQDHQELMATLIGLVARPRTKTAVRDASGRLVKVEESVSPEESGLEQQIRQRQDARRPAPAPQPAPTDTIVQALQGLAQQTAQQGAEMKQLLMHVLTQQTAKRIRRPIRGADGRIERVEEELESAA